MICFPITPCMPSVPATSEARIDPIMLRTCTALDATSVYSADSRSAASCRMRSWCDLGATPIFHVKLSCSVHRMMDISRSRFAIAMVRVVSGEMDIYIWYIAFFKLYTCAPDGGRPPRRFCPFPAAFSSFSSSFSLAPSEPCAITCARSDEAKAIIRSHISRGCFKFRTGPGARGHKDPDSLDCSKLGKPGNRSKKHQTTLLATLPPNPPKPSKTVPQTFQAPENGWAAFGRPHRWRCAPPLAH